MPSGTGQTQTDERCVIPRYLWEVPEAVRLDRKSNGGRGWRGGPTGELVFNGDGVSVSQDEKALEEDGGGGWLSRNKVSGFNATELGT